MLNQIPAEHTHTKNKGRERVMAPLASNAILPTLSHNAQKLQSRLISSTGQAIHDYNMIEDGDRVLVCMSGGKDSHALLRILLALQQRAPITFHLIAINLDQKQPGFPADVLPNYFEQLGVDYRIVHADTYSIVKDKIPVGKTTCGLCSRLRRGVIYRTARELGASKIALGHHRDDIVETLFLNLFFGAKLKAMPPKLLSDDGKHLLIRPLAYCSEKDLASYARHMQFPIIPCNLCGSQEHLQRQNIKTMLQAWEREQPGRVQNIFLALRNIAPSHLADTNLYDFKHLSKSPLNITTEHSHVALELQAQTTHALHFARRSAQ